MSTVLTFDLTIANDTDTTGLISELELLLQCEPPKCRLDMEVGENGQLVATAYLFEATAAETVYDSLTAAMSVANWQSTASLIPGLLSISDLVQSQELMSPSPPKPPFLPPTTPPPSPPSPPPPADPDLPCKREDAQAVCAGPREPCFFDPECMSPNDALGGLGCNAGGMGLQCRFCGFGDFQQIVCPGSLFGPGSALLANPAAGGAGVAVIGAMLALCLCCCCLLVFRRRKKRKKEEDLKRAAEEAKLARRKSVVEDGKRRKSVWAAQPLSQEATEATEESATIAWARVVLDRLVDRGSMGRLFRMTLDSGSEPFMMRRYNVEYLRQHTHSALVKQVVALRDMHHAHLLGIIGLATDRGANYGMVMEYMPRSLARVLARTETSEETAKKVKSVWLSIVADIAGAVAHLHKHGITHFAMHPRNVLFDGAMTVKLADYGRSRETITRQIDNDSEWRTGKDDQNNEPREVYLAPELLRLDGFKPAVDIWSLGCLIARLGSLQRLYHSLPSAHIIMLRVASGEVSPADQLTDLKKMPGGTRVTALVTDCCQLDPMARPSADDVVSRLQDLSSRRRASFVATGDSGSGATPASDADVKKLAQRRASRNSAYMPQTARMPAPGMIQGSLEPNRFVKAAQSRAEERLAGVTQSGAGTSRDGLVTMDLRTLFAKYDFDRSGQLEAKELRHALTELGLRLELSETEMLLAKYDAERKGGLSLEQFARLSVNLKKFKAVRAARKDTGAEHAAGAVAGSMPAAAVKKEDQPIFLSLAPPIRPGERRAKRVVVHPVGVHPVGFAVDGDEAEGDAEPDPDDDTAEGDEMPRAGTGKCAPPRSAIRQPAAAAAVRSGAHPSGSTSPATQALWHRRNSTDMPRASRMPAPGAVPGSMDINPVAVAAQQRRKSRIDGGATARGGPDEANAGIARPQRLQARRASTQVTRSPVTTPPRKLTADDDDDAADDDDDGAAPPTQAIWHARNSMQMPRASRMPAPGEVPGSMNPRPSYANAGAARPQRLQPRRGSTQLVGAVQEPVGGGSTSRDGGSTTRRVALLADDMELADKRPGGFTNRSRLSTGTSSQTPDGQTLAKERTSRGVVSFEEPAPEERRTTIRPNMPKAAERRKTKGQKAESGTEEIVEAASQAQIRSNRVRI